MCDFETKFKSKKYFFSGKSVFVLSSVIYFVWQNKEDLWEHPLRKHAYSNILRILPPKNENFRMKNSGSFHISAQNIDYGYLLQVPTIYVFEQK